VPGSAVVRGAASIAAWTSATIPSSSSRPSIQASWINV
jgi:hypothetical protein